jgi:SAM-dependent methyltransferase
MLRRSRSFGLTRRLQLAATVSGGKDNGQQAARLDCALRRIMEMAPENIGEHAHWLIDSPVIDWDNVPAEVDPHHVTWRGTSIKAGAGIDTTSHETIKRTINPRSARKRAQVETFAEAIRCLSLPTGSRIVDFGSGSGNLVLGLAHLFPVLEFVAVDLKASALKLLAERSQRAGLKNIKTARRDIASFSDEFDVALGLHTCGSASDLVMEQAVQRRAAFLISPCWIGRGSLMNTRALRDGAPRSRRLQELLGDHDFQLIARLADMSEVSAFPWIHVATVAATRSYK